MTCVVLVSKCAGENAIRMATLPEDENSTVEKALLTEIKRRATDSDENDRARSP
jgi:hypothetical protein